MKSRRIAGHLVRVRPGEGPPWVLLHGFTGSPESWDETIAALPPSTGVAAVALPGHAGGPPADPKAGFVDAVDALAEVVAALDPRPVPVCGYSLGGRLAYGLLCRHPERVAHLTAIGAHPGLEDDAERPERAAWDEAWARRLETEGLDAFFGAWSAQPLFASQATLPEAVLERQAALRAAHTPEGLAAAMRQLSLARMPSWWGALTRGAAPVRVLAGGLDEKFAAINARLARLAPRIRDEVIEGVGHNVPLEAPRAVAARLGDGWPER